MQNVSVLFHVHHTKKLNFVFDQCFSLYPKHKANFLSKKSIVLGYVKRKSGTFEHKRGQSDSIEWSRSKILELSSDGYNQREISQELQITKSVVNRDVIFLRKQARESLQYHIQDRIPEEYQNCMTGMKRKSKANFGDCRDNIRS